MWYLVAIFHGCAIEKSEMLCMRMVKEEYDEVYIKPMEVMDGEH